MNTKGNSGCCIFHGHFSKIIERTGFSFKFGAALKYIRELEEAEEWQRTERINKIYAYCTFLRSFPTGKYADEARQHIRQLQEHGLSRKREVVSRNEQREDRTATRQSIRPEVLTPDTPTTPPWRKYLPYALSILVVLLLAIWIPSLFNDKATVATASGNLLPFESANNRYGYQNEAGEVVIPAQYDYAYPFSENRAVVEKDSLHGIINRNGKLLTEIKYGAIEAFSSGMAMVLLNDQYGFIDTTGQEVIAPQFKNAGSFDDAGEAWVQRDGKEFYIDKTGKCVRNCDEQKQVDTSPIIEQPVVDQDKNTWEKIKSTK